MPLNLLSVAEYHECWQSQIIGPLMPEHNSNAFQKSDKDHPAWHATQIPLVKTLLLHLPQNSFCLCLCRIIWTDILCLTLSQNALLTQKLHCNANKTSRPDKVRPCWMFSKRSVGMHTGPKEPSPIEVSGHVFKVDFNCRLGVVDLEKFQV